MLALWGKRNVARLARESGVARETISKILGYKRGIGTDVAPKLAPPLGLDPEDLLTPRAESPNLGTVLARLAELRELVESTGKDTTRSIGALSRAIASLERRLDDEAPGATGAR